MISEEASMASKVAEHDSYPLIIDELEGCHGIYSSDSEFNEQLTGTADFLSSEKTKEGFVFWTPQRNKNRNPDVSRSITVQEKITLALRKLEWPYLFVQFWAPKEVGGRRYLTTLDQPFAVAYLIKGLCWHRKKSTQHEYMVEEEEHLGPPGRVFRSGISQESSPDILMYSMKEFPLRDHAVSCGLRSYLALPVFDLGKNKCVGVLEFLNFQDTIILQTSEIQRIGSALEVSGMRLTQKGTSTVENLKYDQQSQLLEVREMLELAIRTVPQLHLAQVWVRSKESTNTNNDVYVMDRTDFINNACRETNSLVGVSKTTREFVFTSEFQYIHSGQGIIGLAISSTNKSCFCRNLGDFSISEYPMVHYAQRARLSFCFAICLRSKGADNRTDEYVFEFFLQPQSRDDAYICSMLGLLTQIMESKLKSFEIANGSHLDSVVANEIFKRNTFPSLESSQESMLREIVECGLEKEHKLSDKNTSVWPIDRYNDSYTVPEFKEFLRSNDWFCIQAPLKRGYGWIFRSITGEGIKSEHGANDDHVLQENVRLLLREILSIWTVQSNPNILIQFWAPKMIENRPYLSTSDQPFVLGCPSIRLCSCRKHCMKYLYYVGEGAKETELGPIGRVFLNRRPESSPDLCLYSEREFSLRDHFVHHDVRTYLALPLFESHDQKCVGVLEFFGCPFTFEDVVEKLEAANLSSMNINHHSCFKESGFPDKDIVEGQEVALDEINEMIELVRKSPQLQLASVWIPCSECAYVDDKMSCLELISSSDIDLLELSDKRIYDFIKARKFLGLNPRIGVIGRALESENKLCFCQNFCDFSITEQPLAHYAQVARLEFCFAICLQSSHTRNNVYVLEFFLTPGHPWSFMCSLLSIMKQKLKSFMVVSSGQQIQWELVTEAIEFCKEDGYSSLQSGHLDSQYVYEREHHDTKNLVHSSSSDSLASVGMVENSNRFPSAKTKRGKHLKIYEKLNRMFRRDLFLRPRQKEEWDKDRTSKKKVIVVGPWGGNGGTTWDDGSYDGVREITVFSGHCIDSITVVYDKNGKPVSAEKHGGSGGTKSAKIKLQFPEEFLTSVSGHYGPLFPGGIHVIRSITFKSNRTTFGPFGVEEGTPFSLPMEGKQIVGFKGRSGWHLDAIGFRISRTKTTKKETRLKERIY